MFVIQMLCLGIALINNFKLPNDEKFDKYRPENENNIDLD